MPCNHYMHITLLIILSICMLLCSSAHIDTCPKIAETLPNTSKAHSILFLMPPTYSHTIGAYYIAKHYCTTRPNTKIDFFWHSKYFVDHPTHCDGFKFWSYDNETRIDTFMQNAAKSAKWGQFQKMDLSKLMQGVEKIYELSIDDILSHLKQHKYDLVVTHLIQAAAADAAEAHGIPVVMMYTPVVLGMGGVGFQLGTPSLSNPLESPKEALSLRSRLAVLYEMVMQMFPFVWAMTKRLDMMREARGLKKRGLSFGMEDKLKLVYSTWGIEYPRPLDPLVQMIGTPFLQAVAEAPRVSTDNYIYHLDSLKNDEFAVLISFGSFVELDAEFLKPIVDGMLAAHPGLQVLFVDRSGTIETTHPRVTMRNWIDQRGVLAHPKVRLFMSHCGSKGFVEGILNQKPIIAMPFVGDQPLTARHAQDAGVGILLQKSELTKERVTQVVREILERESEFLRNLRKLKQLMSLEDGVKNAAKWIDTVLELGGYDHLRPVIKTPFWVEHHLDLIGVCILGLVGALVLLGALLYLVTVAKRKIGAVVRPKGTSSTQSVPREKGE